MTFLLGDNKGYISHMIDNAGDASRNGQSTLCRGFLF